VGVRVHGVLVNYGEDSIRTSKGGVGGVAVLDNQQAGLTLQIPHVWGMYELVADYPMDWKQMVFWILKVPVGVAMQEALDGEVLWGHLGP